MNGWVVAFLVSQIIVSGYAGARGGAPERWVGGILAVAAVATLLLPRVEATAYHFVFWGVFWVDATLFLALVAVAAMADRFWPLWLAGLQLVTLAMHGVRGYDPGLLPYAYWLLVGKIAYPMMALLVLGVQRHRARRRAGFPEFAWTAQRHAHERRTGGSPLAQARGTAAATRRADPHVDGARPAATPPAPRGDAAR